MSVCYFNKHTQMNFREMEWLKDIQRYTTRENVNSPFDFGAKSLTLLHYGFVANIIF